VSGAALFAASVSTEVLGNGTTLWSKAKILHDVTGKGIINLIMTRDRLLLTGRRIDVDVVPTTMSVKSAALLFKLPNKLRTFHIAISFVW
jgi:hypothetical protein